MNKKKLVFQALKTKAAKFGFNKKELNDLAEQIAETVEDNDDEDQLTEAIDQAVEASLPLMRVMQSQANRLLATAKQKNRTEEEDGGEGEGSEEQNSSTGDNKRFTQLEKSIEQLTGLVNKLAAGKVSSEREKRLKQLVEGTGTMGNQILKGFKRAKFEDDDDFEDYLKEVKKDIQEYKENNSLQGNIGPLAGGSITKKPKNSLTEDELDDIFGPTPKAS